MSTEQEAPNNLGHNVLSGLHKRLHSLDYTDEESTRSNNNNNNNSVEQQPQLTQQRESEYIRIPKKPRTSTYSSMTSTKGTMNKAMTSKATNYKTSNFTATNSKGTSSKLISRTTIITNNSSNNNNNKGNSNNIKKQIISQRPRQCQHPKHSIYELSSVAVANINRNNSIKKLTDNKNNNKKKQKKSKGDAGDVLGNRLYSVYKRFEGLFNIGSNAVMCRRCLHRTDKDPEYTLNPKYVSAKSIYKVNERKKLIIEMKGVDLD